MPVAIHGSWEESCNPLDISYFHIKESSRIFYGVIGEVINTPDCGSGMRRFNSYMAPQLSASMAVISSSSPRRGAEAIRLLGTENNIPLNDGVLTPSIGITLLFVQIKPCRPCLFSSFG